MVEVTDVTDLRCVNLRIRGVNIKRPFIVVNVQDGGFRPAELGRTSLERVGEMSPPRKPKRVVILR